MTSLQDTDYTKSPNVKYRQGNLKPQLSHHNFKIELMLFVLRNTLVSIIEIKQALGEQFSWLRSL